MTEIDRLELRYRRLLRFDRCLWIIYAATSVIPAYFLIVVTHSRLFHAIGVIAILSVAWFGWIVDSQLLKGRMKKEAAACGVTVSFVLSRMVIILMGAFGICLEYHSLYIEPISVTTYGNVLWEILSMPFLVYLALLAGFYRIIYHMAVHFLLKIEGMQAAAACATVLPPDHGRCADADIKKAPL